jgi:hypothetical protein
VKKKLHPVHPGEVAQETMQNGKPVSWVAGEVVVAIWLVLGALCIVWAYEVFTNILRVRL